MLRFKIITTLCLAVLMLQGIFAQKQYNLQKGVILFRSDAPLELIKASSDELKGLFVPEKKAFAFRIPIRSFKGFNGPLQREHFNENYMESDKYPFASFEGKIIEDINLDQTSELTIRAKGILNIHGISQERIIKCDLSVKNNKVSVRSAFTVLLQDHNIAIPKVVHEKLASEIKVDLMAEMLITQ